MNFQLQPIDGAYFTTIYFWVTTAIAVIVAFVGAFFFDKGDYQ